MNINFKSRANKCANACQLNVRHIIIVMRIIKLMIHQAQAWKFFKTQSNSPDHDSWQMKRWTGWTGDGNRMREFNESEKDRKTKTVKGSSSWVIIINNKFAWLLPHVNHADSFFMVFYMSGYQVLNCYWNNLIPNHTGAQCRGTLAWSNGWLCCENPHVCHSCYC